MKAVVVGLGQFGTAAAIALSRAGVETIAIDKNMSPVDLIKDDVELAVCTDATSQESLLAQGVEDADVLVAGIGEDFEAQILVVVQAKRIGVRQIVARATSDIHRRVLEAVGADVVVNPERDAANDTVLRILVPAAGDYVRLAEGLFVVQISAPEGMVGRTLRDQGQAVFDRFQVHLIAARRPGAGKDGKALLDPATRIEDEDLLYFAGRETDLARLQGRETD